MDRFIGRHMPWFILGFVALGIVFPSQFAPLQQHTMLMLAIITFCNSLSGGFRDLAAVFKRPLPILVAFFIMHLVMPAIVLGLGRVVYPNNPDFVSGLVLQFTLPVGVASLMWVGMSGGHMGLCLSMVLMDTLLSPFTIPLTLKLLLGTTVKMDILSMMKDLMLMVGIPALLAMILFEVSKGQVARTLKPKLALPSKLVMLLILTATGSQCSDFFCNIDSWVLIVTVTILALSVLGFYVGHLAARGLRMDFPAGFTLTLMIGFRNISAGIVLAQQYFPVAALLPVSIMPLFQQFLMALIIKVLWKTKDGRAYTAQLEAEQHT